MGHENQHLAENSWVPEEFCKNHQLRGSQGDSTIGSLYQIISSGVNKLRCYGLI